MKRIKQVLPLLAVLTVALFPLADASAHGRVFVGGGVVVGQPYYAYPPYYGYPYYAYPPSPYPVYNGPAPVPYGYQAVPPGYQAAPPGYQPGSQMATQPQPYQIPPESSSDHYFRSENGEYCREYNRDIVIDGRHQHGYGQACRQPDGQWRIVD